MYYSCSKVILQLPYMFLFFQHMVDNLPIVMDVGSLPAFGMGYWHQRSDT